MERALLSIVRREARVIAERGEFLQRRGRQMAFFR